MKNIKIYFLEAKKRLVLEQKSLISEAIKYHAAKAAKTLDLSSINFTVYPNKDWCIPQTGDGGHTADSDWIQIYVDPSPVALKRIINTSLPATIYHEMHHAKRMTTVGYGDKLLEVVITEGLACAYSEEMFPQFKVPWGKYSNEEIKSLLKTFLGHVADRRYDHSEWFFGVGKPYWLGYKVGIYIIRDLKDKIATFDCAKMVNERANEIFKMWRKNFSTL